jgi:protocatechuate 3,4-dioxygenase beta subunit
MSEALKIRYFTEANSAQTVAASNENATDERLRDCVNILVKHIHAAIKEIEPTQDEWFETIKFLTKTGHMSDDWRQEFILLSDVTGVSMLVDAINNRKPSGASESTVLGPFHLEDAPELPMGANICLDGKGEPMLVRGRILDTEGNPIDATKIDVWQANDEGFYDVQQKGIQPDFNLRGVFRTGADGVYTFRAVKPKFYPIPDDGPALHHLRRHHRIAAAQIRQPGRSDQPCRSRSKAPTRRSRRGPHRACPCAQRRRDADLRSREVRSAERGHREALPRHDRAAFHRRAVRRRAGAGRHAAAETRHGLALGGVEQLSRRGSTRTRPTSWTGWHPKC